MSNVCFAFGPDNSYLCNCPTKWVRHNLPAPVERLFTKQPPIKDVYELVLGPNNSYYIGYLDNDGKTYQMNSGLPVPLAKKLSINSQGYVEHDIRTTQITLGPNNSYVIKDKNTMQFSNIPDALAARLKQYRTSGTKLVALGKDDSFVVVGTDVSGLRNLRGHYKDLEQKMAQMNGLGDFHYLSLSTYNAVAADGSVDDPVYMLVMEDGAFQGLVPDNHNERFSVVTSELPNMRAAQATQAAQAPRVVQPMRAAPTARVSRRSLSSSTGSVLKMLSSAAKVANVAAQVMNGGGGGGGGNYDGGFDYGTSDFQAGLQQDTWSSVGGAAGDPIQ